MASRDPARTPVADPCGGAVDSYHRWREDLDLVAAAGFTDYRFGIAWSRIEPADGHISRADIGHYRRIVEGAVARGDHDSLFKDTEQLIGAPNCPAQEPCAIHTDSIWRIFRVVLHALALVHRWHSVIRPGGLRWVSV